MAANSDADLNSEENRQAIWDALFIGKVHVEDLIGLETAGKETGFKRNKLRAQLKDVENAMELCRVA